MKKPVIYKNFLAAVCVKDGAAVPGFAGWQTARNADPASAAGALDNGIIDELIVFDVSGEPSGKSDDGGFADIVGKICDRVRIPVTAAVRKTNPEGIRRLFESGCQKIAFDLASDWAGENVLFASSEYGKSAAALYTKEMSFFVQLPETVKNAVSELIVLPSVDTSDSVDTLDWTLETNPGSAMNAIHSNQTPTAAEYTAGDTEPDRISPDAVRIIQTIPDLRPETVRKELEKPLAGGILGDFGSLTDRETYELKKACDSADIPVFLRKAVYSWDELKKDDKGLIPVVVQEDTTGQVLMVAYMNEEAYEHTIMTGHMTYFSRSRQSLWIKGETSGHFQYVKTLSVDCDYDTILVRIEQIGAACHTGHHSCFFREDMSVPDQKFYKPVKMKAK